MKLEDLTPELQEKAKACASVEDILALAEEEGFELSDGQLESMAGGFWDCDDYFCGDYGDGLDQDPGWN